MCEFFSFVHDGKKIYYFDGDQRKNGVKMPDGNKISNYDSHSSITCYYRLDDDEVNKFEYNPFTDKLVLDTTLCEWDGKMIREQLAEIDWQPIAGDVEGAREFIRGLKDIPWLKPDGTLEDSEEIKVFETWSDAKDAVLGAAENDALDATWAAAIGAVLDAVRDAGRSDAKDAAKNAAMVAARNAAWYVDRLAAIDASWDAGYLCVMCNVCGDLQIEEKHREHIRKRFEIWQHGYGVMCAVDGIIYAYKKVE